MPADIVFIFDGSESVTLKFFKKFIEFAKQIVSRYPASEFGVHYASIQFSDQGVVEFNLQK